MQSNQEARHPSLKRLFEASRLAGPAALAAALVESEQTVTNWAKRGVSKAGAMKAQAIFGCSANWVLHGTLPRSVELHSGRNDKSNAAPLASADDTLIPQYQSAGAMGNGLILEDRPPGLIRSWSVDKEWLRLNVPYYSAAKNLCIVTGFGTSMQPRFNPGDPLLLDSGIKTVDSDGIYFFRVGTNGYIKQLQRIPTEAGLIVRAKSLNRDYDPFDISAKMDFEIFGKVLTVWRSEQV